jgi:acyl-CoA synthetase (NDP forming)
MLMDLGRLLRPQTLVVIGGHAASRVIAQCRQMSYRGRLYAVNRIRSTLETVACVPSLDALPEVPDAAFVAVGREAAVDIVAGLAGMGAGGAVCHSSGFAEIGAEGELLQKELIRSAGDMPLMGPNCYGFVNYLDGVPLWPDQHGGKRCEQGVAIVSQSGNMAINLSMQRRGLPLAYLFSLGNQAQLGTSGVLSALLDDPRVTAIGLHIEGIDDLGGLDAAARAALEKGVPLIALKTGRSQAGGELTLSHTASLAGEDRVFDALLGRLGIARVHTLSAFLETLKLLHCVGPLSGGNLVSMSCSGGEASLMADCAERRAVSFRPFTNAERERVEATVNPLVKVTNPFDYHTFDWADETKLRATFESVLGCGFDLCLFVLDFPRSDRCEDSDWWIGIKALAAARVATAQVVAVVATLPESLPEEVSERLLELGLVPLAGVEEALSAAEAAVAIGRSQKSGPSAPLLIATCLPHEPLVKDEFQAKCDLARHGLTVPEGRCCDSPDEAVAAARAIGFPVVVKLLSAEVVHKSDVGGVVVGVADPDTVLAAATQFIAMGGRILVERMVDDAVAELIIGAGRDRALGLHMVVGTGGDLVELSTDSRVLTLPLTAEDARRALSGLRYAPLLRGYRGRPEADLEGAVEAILGAADYVMAHRNRLVELDINPLLVRPQGKGAVVADALVRIAGGTRKGVD